MLDDLVGSRSSLVAIAVLVPLVSVLLTLLLALVQQRSPGPARWVLGAMVVVCLVSVANLTLPPRPRTWRVRHEVVLDPLAAVRTVLAEPGWGPAHTFAAANLLMLFPLGCALGLLLRPPWAVVAVTGTSLSIEYLQWVTANGRLADVGDVILNVAGGVLGIAVARLCAAYASRPGAARAPQEGAG